MSRRFQLIALFNFIWIFGLLSIFALSNGSKDFINQSGKVDATKFISGAQLCLLFLVFIGSAGITNDYATGFLYRVKNFTTSNRELFIIRSSVSAIQGFIVGLISAIGALIDLEILAQKHHAQIYFDKTTWLSLIGGLIGCALYSLFALYIGWAIRNRLHSNIVQLAFALIVSDLIGLAWKSGARYLPKSLFISLYQDPNAIIKNVAWWQGLVGLAIWAGVALFALIIKTNKTDFYYNS